MYLHQLPIRRKGVTRFCFTFCSVRPLSWPLSPKTMGPNPTSTSIHHYLKPPYPSMLKVSYQIHRPSWMPYATNTRYTRKFKSPYLHNSGTFVIRVFCLEVHIVPTAVSAVRGSHERLSPGCFLADLDLPELATLSHPVQVEKMRSYTRLAGIGNLPVKALIRAPDPLSLRASKAAAEINKKRMT